LSDNKLDRLHFRLAGVIHELKERFPFPKTGERQMKIVGAFVDRIGAELQDIDNALYQLAQDRGGTAELEYVPESSRDVCSRCQQPLNNVSPGFGIVTDQPGVPASVASVGSAVSREEFNETIKTLYMSLHDSLMEEMEQRHLMLGVLLIGTGMFKRIDVERAYLRAISMSDQILEGVRRRRQSGLSPEEQ